ncbi:MAG: AraC family transcriptional regulator [Akkermansiaceae bacterium]|nr:AraC family transcriptional regulator [Armatimonadota bacterium]
MIAKLNIHSYFRPLQPTVAGDDKTVRYRELSPDPRLQPFVYCYWQLSTNQPLAETFLYRVVADGCMDVFIDWNDPSKNYVMGFSTKHTEFALTGTFNYVGIRFLPTALPLIYRIDASQLTDRVEPLGQVLPRVADDLANLMPEQRSTDSMRTAFDAYLLQALAHSNLKIETSLLSAIDTILTSQATLAHGRDLDSGISARQLRRLFALFVGDSPKVFSRVIRFQRLLYLQSLTQTRADEKLYYSLGYYDQAHFIKEFKTFYGQTPCQATRS